MGLICVNLSLPLQVPAQPLMPLQVMPRHAAAGYCHSSSVTPVSVVGNFSRGPSDVHPAPLTPVDLGWMHRMHSVSTTMPNPFISVPVAACEPSPALMAELINYRMWHHQQLLQQQILYRSYAAPDNELLHPFAFASMPLPAPRCIPAAGVHPYPVVKPVLRQPLVPTQLDNDPRGQFNVRDKVNWLSNTGSRGDIWTTHTDAQNIWSSAAIGLRLRDSHLTVCNREQNHMVMPSVMGSDGALSSAVYRYKTAASEAGQWATSTVVTGHSVAAAAAHTGLCDRQDIWPRAFGPFARPPQSNVRSVGRLPPGLETQLLSRIGVIGQREPEMQKIASVEGYDSGVDSACGDGQDAVGRCGSGELILASSASDTAVCDSDTSSIMSVLHDAVKHQSVVPSQEHSAAINGPPPCQDVTSSMTAKTTPRQKNSFPHPDTFTSEDVFKSFQCSRHSRNYLCTTASERDDSVPSLDIDRTLEQTENSVCKIGTSHPPSDAVSPAPQTDSTVLLRDIIARLSDMLRRPDELQFVDICNALYDRLTARSSASCFSQGAEFAGTPCESAACNNVNNPHTPSESSASVASRQDDGSWVDIDVNRCTAPASHSTTCLTDVQTVIKSDCSDVSLMSDSTHDADSQTESNLTDRVSLPEAQTSLCSTVSVACSRAGVNPDTALADVPPLHLCETAALQQVLSEVAEGRLKSSENDSERQKKRALGSSLEDLLDLLQRWKSS